MATKFTLAEHLALGYDHLVRGRMGKWSIQDLANDIKNDEQFAAEVKKKFNEIAPVAALGPERCFVTCKQFEMITKAYELLDSV